MHRIGERVVISASDLSRAAACELELMRRLDVMLGRLPVPEKADDPLMAQLAELGDSHEAAELDRYRAELGDDAVLVIERPAPTHEGLTAARDATFDAMRAGVPVIAQGCLYDGGFMGFADFLVRRPQWTPEHPAYAVHDTKLARHAKVTALLQLAAYADQLRAGGIDPGDDVTLVLGDRSRPTFPTAELEAVFRLRRRRLERLVAARLAAEAPVAWLDPDHNACGTCAVCADEVARSRDVLLTAGVRATQRKRLVAAGVRTIDDLAARTEPVPGLAPAALERLRAQAALQVRQDPPGGEPGPVSYELVDARAIAAMPPPDDGDIYFDFEGDPLWAGDEAGDQGLEYLFGVVENDGTFRPFWAHDRAQEKQALLDFLDYLRERRRAYPRMHVYHYAPYERTALLRLAGRHGVGEAEVDGLLRDGVLVDLYAVVRRSLRVSQPSYSIKKLEPLYMGEHLRGGDVTTAGDSIVEYHRYAEAARRGDTEQAQRLLDAIADYNEYDCVSTLRLRDWLLDLARAQGHEPGAWSLDALDVELDAPEPTDAAAVAARLRDLAGDPETRDADQQALAMIGAATEYHRREGKPFWWAHFDRLATDPQDWPAGRDALVLRRVEVVEPWGKPPKKRSVRRVLRAVTDDEPGHAFGEKASGYLVYAPPAPPGLEGPTPAHHGASSSMTAASAQVNGRDLVLTIEERLPAGVEEFDDVPVAVTAAAPPPARAIEDALLELALRAEREWPHLPADPAVQLLRRVPPHLAGGGPLPRTGDHVADITAAVRDLDHSYLAVQGPPGTGKTYVASHVIKALVDRGWRVGVVAQSHAVVENVLLKVAGVGVPPERIAKTKTRTDDAPWEQPKDATAMRAFLDEHPLGVVVGGTAWDFCSTKGFDEGCLDLLVVDEAGQYSLANTLAVSRVSSRLLLLGDPAQLPQVSQGIHPEPVDESALGWLAQGRGALPADLGYFLERSWRMHPAVCAPVSALSYEGRLRSQEPATTDRALDGVEPGLGVIEVVHRDSSVASPEEAHEVVAVVAGLLGRAWHDGAATRELGQGDVVVVAPYNAQVGVIRKALERNGFDEVRVGTVDLFQGQEAPVAIMSMTASALADLPRGADFLLSRNRLNVALSRAQWRAVLVRSDILTDLVPTTPEQLLALGAFVRLCEASA